MNPSDKETIPLMHQCQTKSMITLDVELFHSKADGKRIINGVKNSALASPSHPWGCPSPSQQHNVKNQLSV